MPTICLNMIVKNESQIIEQTLTNLCNKIKFDYWVICDTGSTDNTVDIINKFFEKENIPGKLYIEEWVDFAHNRTRALEYAFEKTDLLLVFDADDGFEGTFTLPKTVDVDGYYIKINLNENLYDRIALINNRVKWYYKSVLHEYIACDFTPKIVFLKTNGFIKAGCSGSRSSDPQKYLKDAILLENAYKKAKEIDDKLYERYSFYCANSNRDANQPDKAVDWYRTVLTQNNWEQEKYISCIEIYRCYSKLNTPELGLNYLVESYKYDNERIEGIFELIKYYCCADSFTIAMGYYKFIQEFYEDKFPSLDYATVNKLFINSPMYNFFLPYYMIIVADRINDRKLGIKMYEIVFSKKPKIFIEVFLTHFINNFQFFVQHIKRKSYTFKLANDYLKFLVENNVQLDKFPILTTYKKYGIKF